MATTTPNLGLTLPTGTEKVSRQIINDNMSAIDTAIGNINGSLTNQFITLTKVSSKISNVERVGGVRYGNIVILFMTFTVGTDITNTTEELFSGAPKAWYTIRSTLMKTQDSGRLARVAVDGNGKITNAYTANGIPTGLWEGTIVYITNDP